MILRMSVPPLGRLSQAWKGVLTRRSNGTHAVEIRSDQLEGSARVLVVTRPGGLVAEVAEELDRLEVALDLPDQPAALVVSQRFIGRRARMHERHPGSARSRVAQTDTDPRLHAAGTGVGLAAAAARP